MFIVMYDDYNRDYQYYKYWTRVISSTFTMLHTSMPKWQQCLKEESWVQQHIITTMILDTFRHTRSIENCINFCMLYIPSFWNWNNVLTPLICYHFDPFQVLIFQNTQLKKTPTHCYFIIGTITFMKHYYTWPSQKVLSKWHFKLSKGYSAFLCYTLL